MLSLKYIRNNAKSIQKSLSRKQSDIDIYQLIDLDAKRREYLLEVENLRAEKNSVSNKIAMLKKNGRDATSEISAMKSVSDNIKEIDCPFTGEKVLLIPALNPNVALIHVPRCDAFGNAQIDGLQFMDIDMAMAANRVILTTERIISNDQIRRAPDQTKIPFIAVDAVVEVPYGSAPHECYGIYEPMFKHMDAYAALTAKDPEAGVAEYLERHYYGPNCWSDYLDLLGIGELLDASRRGRSIYND